MNVVFKTSFARDLKRIRNKDALKSVEALIKAVETARTLSEISGLKKLRGEDRHYRVRLGEYRVGLIVEGVQITFVRFLHRNEIYRYFP